MINLTGWQLNVFLSLEETRAKKELKISKCIIRKAFKFSRYNVLYVLILRNYLSIACFIKVQENKLANHRDCHFCLPL